ncbi:MAG: AAA family ATPase [Rhodocyclales bacterium]|nr:AAA family ATPase [Rhodocyclales bacterium]
MKTAPRLVLRLLGGFALERDGASCKIAYEKGRGLLAYLAVESGRDHMRTSLAAMLWPDLARDAALSNLRLVLHNLRQALDVPAPHASSLHIDREHVRLDPTPDLRIDIADFSAPDPKCPSLPCPEVCTPCLGQMEVLAAQYRGAFMAGFSLPDCPEFEEWLQIRREALHLRALTLLARLGDCHGQTGAYTQSLSHAMRFLELEPWSEEGLRRIMRIHALTGQQGAALAQYEAGCRALKRELGVLPSEETHALAERIRQGELSPTTRRREDTPPTTALPLPVAEKRQVTVLYCELIPAAADDPDEALALLKAPQAHCSEIIARYSGYLVQVRGGSLLAYFGYPLANESAARLSVQAALATTRTAFAGLELRLSVHTGVVIVGDLRVPDALGATSGLAIQLRHLANSGEVVISGATQRLVAGYFESTSLGLQQLSGNARPQEVFRVLRESGATSRLEAAATLTPLVGRKAEIATLLDLWRDVRRGVRRTVLLQGEAGIGKSRLICALRDRLHEEAHLVRELRCFPEHSQSPFYPLAGSFGLACQFAADDTPEAKFDKLADYVARHYANSDQGTLPLLAKMLALPLRLPHREAAESPQRQREQILAILLARLNALAAKQPTLLIIEDLHWADPSTLELLAMFVGQERATPVLTVLTARPEFQPPWSNATVRMLPLGGLGTEETTGIVKAVAPRIGPDLVHRIVQRADGIPLFAEEMARDLVAGVDQSKVPFTLQDLLMARLDAMGAAKRIAQSAATIGRQFDFDLLQMICDVDAATLKALLGKLQDAGVLTDGANSVFQFRHSLIRDAAYESQTRVDREKCHRRIAAAMKSAGTKARPEILAQHWAAGGANADAATCWIEAGQLASQHSATREAMLHFKSGLAMIDKLRDDPERVRMELDLNIGLGAAACAAQGYASAEGAAAYSRAAALCDQHDDKPDMFRAAWGLWASASSRTDYACALDLARQLLRMAGQGEDPIHAQQAHFAVAATSYWRGEFPLAREHLESARSLYQATQHHSHVTEFGEDAGVTSAAYLSWVQWFLGFPDQAQQSSRQSIALARQLGHPFSLAYALTFASILHCRLRQPGKALDLAEETLNLANSHQFPLWQIGGTLAHGWALALQNNMDGIQTLRQCVEGTRDAMGGVTLVVLEPLVDAYTVLGLHEAALRANDEAVAAAGAIGDHHVDAELHRLKAESLLGATAGNQVGAEACFQSAIETSQRQQARSLELRAATGLARLWQAQGKRDEARSLLDNAYRWFTEGLDTPDMLNALALLDALGGQGANDRPARGIADGIPLPPGVRQKSRQPS